MGEKSEAKVTGQPEAGAGRGRPGCITVYALLLALGGIGNLLISAFFGLNLMGGDAELLATGAIITLCTAAWSLLPFVMAVGLWRMRMWAWWLVVISQAFAIAMTCLVTVLVAPAFMVVADPGYGTAEVLIVLAGIPLALLLSGIILYWFLTNRDRFRQPVVVHVGGRALEEPGSDNVLIIVGVTVIGVVVILCVVSVAVIALLTLLGPQIGTTFSEITRGLMTPAP